MFFCYTLLNQVHGSTSGGSHEKIISCFKRDEQRQFHLTISYLLSGFVHAMAVLLIAVQRMTYIGQLDPDLVRTSCVQTDFYQTETVINPLYLVIQNRQLASRRVFFDHAYRIVPGVF